MPSPPVDGGPVEDVEEEEEDGEDTEEDEVGAGEPVRPDRQTVKAPWMDHGEQQLLFCESHLLMPPICLFVCLLGLS